MRLSLILLALGLCGFLYYQNPQWLQAEGYSAALHQQNTIVVASNDTPAALQPQRGRRIDSRPVEMYSATWCGYCKLMAREMDQAGIRYVQYEIDMEAGRQQELNQRLNDAGYRGGRIGLPVLFAGSRIFMGTTPIDTLRAAMSGQ